MPGCGNEQKDSSLCDGRSAVLTVRIVADEHHVSTKTVRNWIEAGIIPAYRIGRVIRMRRSEVEAALKPV